MPTFQALPLLLVLASGSAAQEPAGGAWPHLRGPRGDGRANGAGVFDGEVALAARWRVPIGPAYSGVSIADGRAVTLFSDGTQDHVVALRCTDGSTLWRRPLGPTYLGHDGSDDGGISSPAIGDGRMFVVGPHGRLVALRMEDGAELWSIDLVADLGAKLPDYGFITTPLVTDGLVLVQAGGSEGRLLCAFAPATGELVWSLGEGEAGSASPVAMELAGKRQVVVLNGREILGVDPASGSVLWTVALDERSRAGTGLPGAIDGERFFAYVSGSLAVFRVREVDGGLAAEELYRTRELGRTYADPVVHDGHLYGFNSDFLTCVDAADGKRRWKSRPPGGAGLIVVDDRLVVFGAEGVVAVAAASPEGYREEARLAALEHSSFTWPSFADGHVFVRNSREIACLEVRRAAAGVADTSAPRATEPAESVPPAGSAFARFVRAAEEASDKDAVVDAWFAEHPELPILEGELVHFVYRGEVEDVAVTGSMLDGTSPESMERIAGTDVHYKTYRIEPGTRWEYAFQVDFGPLKADPANPRTTPAGNGPDISEVLAPGYTVPTHFLPKAEGARGRVESFEFAAAEHGTTREIQVWLPPGYDAGEKRYPLLLVHQGPDWLAKGGLVNTLDNLVGRSVRPLVVAGIAPMPQWWFESGGTGTEAYMTMLVRELVPALEQRYRLSPDSADRAVMGAEGFGLTAIFTALAYPETFARAAAVSVSLGDVTRHALFRRIAEGPVVDVRLYVGWNRYEARDRDAGMDLRADGARLLGALKERGYAVTGGELPDAHGWGGWRAGADDWLQALFPIE